MTEYGCSVCEYTSYKKENTTRHITNKKICGEGIREIVEIPIDITCEYCNKSFSTKTSLSKHVKNNCKLKDQIKDAKIKELEKKLRTRSTPIENQTEDTNYIYLIKIYPYEDNIYKVGRTSDLPTRLASYKRYKTVFITSCTNDVACEGDLLELYRSKTVECKEMGSEYFYGDYQTMKGIIQSYFG